MSVIHSESMANASRAVAAVETWLSNVRSQKKMSSHLQESSAQARASAESQMNAPVVHDTAKDPFNFNTGTAKKSKRVPATTPAATTPAQSAPVAGSAIPPPPGTPVSSLPPDQRPTEVPPGVPEYNWRMCQYDLIHMGQNKHNLTIDQPAGQAQSK